MTTEPPDRAGDSAAAEGERDLKIAATGPSDAPAQLPLIEAESDEALLLASVELRKRYTARQAEKIEWRRDCIVGMLGGGVFTHERIAELAHVNARVVAKLAELHAALIARDLQAAGDRFIAEAAMTFESAKQKRDGASYRDQMVGGGILATNGLAIKLAGSGMSADMTPAIEAESENEKLRKAREFLERRRQSHSPVKEAEVVK